MRSILAAFFALAASSTAYAREHVRPGEVVVVTPAPPPPVVYYAPPPAPPPAIRGRYVWVDGRWVGRQFVPAHWELIRPALSMNVAVGPVQVSLVR